MELYKKAKKFTPWYKLYALCEQEFIHYDPPEGMFAFLNVKFDIYFIN